MSGAAVNQSQAPQAGPQTQRSESALPSTSVHSAFHKQNRGGECDNGPWLQLSPHCRQKVEVLGLSGRLYVSGAGLGS